MAMSNHGFLYRRWQFLAQRHPSAVLLAAQLLSLLLYPVFDGRHSGRALFGAFGVLFPLLAVWVVSRSPAVKWVAWLVAVRMVSEGVDVPRLARTKRPMACAKKSGVDDEVA